jgi:mannose-6-phosphate isomerase
MPSMPYPMRFRPIYKTVIWGGRRLETLLNRRLPEGGPVGESWELADFDDPATGAVHSSVIDNGPLAGRTLREAIAAHPREILGDGRPAGPFPLLIKYIDARKNLSVQVHPDESSAARIGRGARPKTECWFILDAEPGAAIYRGLKPGTTPETFRNAVRDGAAAELMVRETVRPGGMYFVPAGTVHAIGAGVVLAEVQQASDTTYRLWDWNRVDPFTGKGRELHLDAGLEAIRWDAVPPAPTRCDEGAFAELVRCEHFRVGRRRLDGHAPRDGDGRPRPQVWMCLSGRARLHWPGAPATELAAGDTVLLPAAEPGRVAVEVIEPLDVLET